MDAFRALYRSKCLQYKEYVLARYVGASFWKKKYAVKNEFPNELSRSTCFQHNALVWEYYRQAKELVPYDIGQVLDALYDGEGFKIVESRYLGLIS